MRLQSIGQELSVTLFRTTTGEFMRGLHLLGQLLEVGQSLQRAVPEVIAGVSHRRAKSMWEGVGQSLLAGRTLSEALARTDASQAVVALVRAGEDRGNVPEVLLRAAGSRIYQPESGRRACSTGRPTLECLVAGPEIRIANAVLHEAIKQDANSIAFDAVWPPAAQPPWPLPDRCVRKPSPATQGPIQDAIPKTSFWFRIGETWIEQGTLPLFFVTTLVGRYLFLAELPYWSRKASDGSFFIECDQSEFRIAVSHTPERRPTLLLRVERL